MLTSPLRVVHLFVAFVLLAACASNPELEPDAGLLEDGGTPDLDFDGGVPDAQADMGESDSGSGTDTGSCEEPDCGPPAPRLCRDDGTHEDGTPCDPIGSDWWPSPEVDESREHHVPEGSQILDLRTEHITPFGGWFQWSSPSTETYRNDYSLCWSTDASGLDTAALMDAAAEDGRCQGVRARAPEGMSIERPGIVVSLEPSTTYYVRVAVLHYTGSVDGKPASNVIEVRTHEDPRVELSEARPRMLGPSTLDSLRRRYDEGDARLAYWLELMRPLVDRALSDGEPPYNVGQYAVSAALIGYATGDETYRQGAKTLLFDVLLAAYEGGTLVRNQYRWAGANLGILTDLLWSDLTTEERQRILDAMLDEDEEEANLDPRFADTDQYLANTHIQLAHAIATLGSDDLSEESQNRMSAVFETAMRRWYGVILVKMRRSVGIYGLSGGTMDDGADYGRGTQEHWMDSMWILDNAGMPQDAYAEWVWNNVRTHNIYAVVPDRRGVVSFGDVEGDGIMADGTHVITTNTWSTEGLKLCLLNRFGRTEQAGYLKHALLANREPTSRASHQWAFLCDGDDVVEQDPSSLPTAFRSSGYGLVHDRTSWESDASFLFYTAGWRGVDHNQPDVGHFSFWVDGDWVTHETPAYRRDAGDHNLLLLSETGQVSSPSSAEILGTSSDADHFYVLSENATAYAAFPAMSHRSVRRALYWDKRTDRVVVYDRVEGEPGVGHEQRMNTAAPVARLYDAVRGEILEVLTIVNGTGELVESSEGLGVDGIVMFDRETGELR